MELEILNILWKSTSQSEAAKESLVQDEKSLETIDEKPEEAKVSDETDAKQPAAAEEKSV